MRKLIVAVFIAIYFLTISAFGQSKPIATNNHPGINRPSPAPPVNQTRNRLISSEKLPIVQGTATSAWGDAPIANVSARPRQATPVGPPAAVVSAHLAQTYRVGVGDILDIQIPDSLSNKSTLYTVADGGLLEYPLVGSPLAVGGLTTDAIAARLKASIRVLDNPDITVKVRDYASHRVHVIGFVSAPGPKVLRREAVPLYVVLSQALPLAEATTVTIVRAGREIAAFNLRETNSLNQLVVAGDVIKVKTTSANSSEFFYAGGEVNAPGQKAYHSGLTLTQAVLASGGASRNAGQVVRVSRQNSDGRLLHLDYNLESIQAGKTADPLLQKGDRIEVSRN